MWRNGKPGKKRWLMRTSLFFDYLNINYEHAYRFMSFDKKGFPDSGKPGFFHFLCLGATDDENH